MAPRLGQHSAEILQEIGYDAPTIKKYIAHGIAAQF